MGTNYKEVRIITTRKKPGPKTESPLDAEIKIRIDKATLDKIEYCKKELNTTRSDVLRKGVQCLHDKLQEK